MYGSKLTDDTFLYYRQVWRNINGFTYKVIHQSSFKIYAIGFHEFLLNSDNRSVIEAGDVIGLFTCLSNEAPVIWFDEVQCGFVTLVRAR